MNQYKSSINRVKRQKMLAQTKEELVDTIASQQKEIKHLEELITQKMSENEALLQKIQKQQEKQKGDSQTQIKYNKEISWVGKIVFALITNDRPMQSSEIISFIEQQDSAAFKDAIDKSKHLSPNFVKAIKYGRIKQYKIKGILGHFYALPQWFNEKGILKNQYKEKESIV